MTNIVGSKYNNWTILEDLGVLSKTTFLDKRDGKIYNSKKRYVLARCKCGIIKEQIFNSLTSGKAKECHSCANAKTSLVHGKVNTREYWAWVSMRTRCYSPKFIGFKNWGGRGIKVCNRWLGENGFINFYSDMGQKPTLKHSLDRIDNNGDYEPGNCRWATRKQQNLNKRQRVSNGNNTNYN